jgi:hypothetical protein
MNLHHHHTNPFNQFIIYLTSIFNTSSMHVKISKTGMRLLKNKQLTEKVIDAIIKNKTELNEGKSVTIEHNGNKVTLGQSNSTESETSAKSKQSILR